MTDMPRFGVPYADHLLPANSSPLERALSASDARILDAPTQIIRTILDPDRCPTHLLPYLAAHWGVDDWDERWPEPVRRAVIKAAPEIHRKRGTRYAVETALSALRVKAVIKEWFELTPPGPPHTFSVTAFVTGQLLQDSALITPDIGQAIRRAIIRAKRHSQWFSFAVAAAATTRLNVAARARQMQVVTPAMVPQLPVTGAGLAVSTRGRIAQVAQVAGSAEPVKTLPVRIVAAARARLVQIVQCHMEAVPA